MHPPVQPWALYLLLCSGNTLYAGISPRPLARYAQHVVGKGAKYTRSHPPLRLLAVQWHDNRSAAAAAEYRLKQLQRPEKLRWALPFLVKTIVISAAS
jgi:putative endonuclease